MGDSAEQTEHRALLRESAADFVARESSIARVRRLRASPGEYERGVWRRMAELGWLGILVPERYGGLGLGLAEAAIVAEALGGALVPEPFTASAVLAAETLIGGDNEELKRALLPRLVSGDLVPALAWQERAAELSPSPIHTEAVPFEGGYRLNGEKRYVAAAAGADGYAVSARTPEGLALFWVERDAPGSALRLEEVADGRHFGVLALADVVVPREKRIASAAAAQPALERAFDRATAVECAELYGVMSRALDMTLEYLKTRVQFGRPIGSFQALQHRAVDLYIHRQIASAVLEEVLRRMDGEPEAALRAALASRLKARCAEAASLITRQAIQLHGAIGFTDEYDVGLYLKRALVLCAWLGNAVWHRRRYARIVLQGQA